MKKLAAYHHYYAVNAAVASTLRAAVKPGVSETPESYGVASVKTQPPGDQKAGVVWHTQGSGKSLSMVFCTGKIVLALYNLTIVMITDRNDLDVHRQAHEGAQPHAGHRAGKPSVWNDSKRRNRPK